MNPRTNPAAGQHAPDIVAHPNRSILINNQQTNQQKKSINKATNQPMTSAVGYMLLFGTYSSDHWLSPN